MPLHSAEYTANHNTSASGETERQKNSQPEGFAVESGQARNQGQAQAPKAEGGGQGVCGEVVISSPLGLHARPAAQLVQLAQQFESSVTLKTDSGQADAKSILDILSLAAGIGMQLRIEINGPDQEQALLSLTNFFSNI